MLDDDIEEVEAFEVLIDRDAALLTRRQREILLMEFMSSGEKKKRELDNVSNAVVRNRRKDARYRLYNTIIDMGIITRGFSSEDYDRIVQKLEEAETDERWFWEWGEIATIEFIYEISDLLSLQDILAAAILEVERRKRERIISAHDIQPFELEIDLTLDFNFSLEDEHLSVEDIIARHEDDGYELSQTEQVILYQFALPWYRAQQEIDEA